MSKKYLNDICPSCKIDTEDILHFENCPAYNNNWIGTKRRILSIINSFKSISKFPEWNNNWLPLSKEIKFFPIWFIEEYSIQFYDNFNYSHGKIGLLPTNLFEVFKLFEINKKLFNECSYLCYLDSPLGLRVIIFTDIASNLNCPII